MNSFMIAFARGLRGYGLRDEPIQASGVEVVSHDARDFGSGFRHAESKEASEFGIFVQVFFRALAFGKARHFVALFDDVEEFWAVLVVGGVLYVFLFLFGLEKFNLAIDVGDVGGERFASAEHAYDEFLLRVRERKRFLRRRFFLFGSTRRTLDIVVSIIFIFIVPVGRKQSVEA